MHSGSIHLEKARRILEEGRPDPAVREQMRKKTLLALLIANDIHLPNAEELDSAALRRVLDAATEGSPVTHSNGR